jgi:DNA-binding transcriptional MerR regulator
MVKQQQFTIKQLARLAEVSVRTLHYYDQLGLLKPQRQKKNNYRLYGEAAIPQLQQILFYKELGFDLKSIKLILDEPGFDYQQALVTHKAALIDKVERTKLLIQTIDRTLDQMKGKIIMTENEYFVGFSDEQQAEYEKQASERWDPVVVKESNRRWKALSDIEKQGLMKNGERITLSLRDAMSEEPGSENVQKLVEEWQGHIIFFYKYTPQILLGLGHAYLEDPQFSAFYTRVDPKLPKFFFDAIRIYCERKGVTD